MTVSGGGQVNATNAICLVNGAGSGTLYLSGGTTAAPNIVVQVGGTGTLYFNGGTLKPTGNNTLSGLTNAYVQSGWCWTRHSVVSRSARTCLPTRPWGLRRTAA